MEYAKLIEMLSKEPSAGALVVVLALWALREVHKLRKEKEQKQESKISKLEETLVETNINMVKLNLNFENLNKRLDEKFGQIESNKRSLDAAHQAIRQLKDAKV